MSSRGARSRAQVWIVTAGLGQLAQGVLLLFAPARLARAGAVPPSTVLRRAARALGIRLIGQSVVLLVNRTPATARAALAVDALHGSSMLALAAASPKYRRPALGSAAAAVAAVAALARASRSV